MLIPSLTGYFTILLFIVAFGGDYIVTYSSMGFIKALFDNITHALVAGICWLIIVINHKHSHTVYSVYEILLCTVVASLIDIDHFVAAKSFRLKDATQLQQRPPLHSSTLPCVVSLGLLVVSYWWLRSWLLVRISFVIWVAFATHHIRDAHRRGFWFSPFGSTPPVPYYLYIALTLLVPHLITYIFDRIDLDKLRVIHPQTQSIVQHF